MTIALAGYAYFYKKQELDKKNIGKGAIMTTFASVLFLLLGFPFLIELLIVLLASKYFKKHLINNDELLDLLAKHTSNNWVPAKANFAKVVEALKAKLDATKSA